MTPDETPPLSAGLLPLYEEATAIAERSPASAAALLRMLVKALVRQAGGTGRHLTKDIDQLVAAGMDVGVLRALDAVQLSDAQSRKPAELDLADGHSEVRNLSVLVHLLARAAS